MAKGTLPPRDGGEGRGQAERAGLLPGAESVSRSPGVRGKGSKGLASATADGMCTLPLRVPGFLVLTKNRELKCESPIFSTRQRVERQNMCMFHDICV